MMLSINYMEPISKPANLAPIRPKHIPTGDGPGDNVDVYQMSEGEFWVHQVHGLGCCACDQRVTR